MMLFTQTVLDALESGSQVDALYTDFSKAFDTRHCTFDHQCGQCLANGNHSVESNKSSEASNFQKKDGANVPKVKKSLNSKVTEPKAPSFMTRPRLSIHNCFANNSDESEPSFPMPSFNRHSLKRKSMRPVKENKAKSPENTLSPFRVQINRDFQDNTQLNVSYTICDKSNDKLDGENEALGGISNITDDMKESESLQNLDVSSTEDNTLCGSYQPNCDSAEIEILETDSLQKSILNILDDVKESNTGHGHLEEAALSENSESERKMRVEVDKTVKIERSAEERVKCPKSYDFSKDIQSHVVFLIADEFIDDEYDSYINATTLENLQEMENAGLFQIFKTLAHIRMERCTITVPKKKLAFNVKQGGLRKVAKPRNLVKILKRRSTNDQDIWGEVEKIVRTAITDLKREFKNKIYQKTTEKIDSIMLELAKVLNKTDNSIEKSCERTSIELIHKLEKIIKK